MNANQSKVPLPKWYPTKAKTSTVYELQEGKFVDAGAGQALH
jgi:hypothetical protein